MNTDFFDELDQDAKECLEAIEDFKNIEEDY